MIAASAAIGALGWLAGVLACVCVVVGVFLLVDKNFGGK